MKGIIDIGIDPGVKTGFAVREIRLKTWVILLTLTFWETIDTLTALQEEYQIRKVVIEDPNQNKPVFSKKGVSIDEVLKREKIAQNVGMNKRDAQLLITYCEKQGLPIIASSPTKKSLTKLSHEQFQRITGISKRCSGHVRDAVMLIFE